MPLSLTTEEMDLLLTLAAPIEQRQRDQFLRQVAAELEAKRQAGEISEGSVHRVGRAFSGAFSIRPRSARASTAARESRDDRPVYWGQPLGKCSATEDFLFVAADASETSEEA